MWSCSFTIKGHYCIGIKHFNSKSMTSSKYSTVSIHRSQPAKALKIHNGEAFFLLKQHTIRSKKTLFHTGFPKILLAGILQWGNLLKNYRFISKLSQCSRKKIKAMTTVQHSGSGSKDSIRFYQRKKVPRLGSHGQN